MLKKLRNQVCGANRALTKYGLVTFTWGNVSAIDRAKGLVVIKPSGVAFEDLTADAMVVVDLDGNIVEGKYKPSSDTPTHLELYKAFADIGGIAHTHSIYATAFAQAGRAVPAYGTTHADAFYGDVPCTRALTREEVETAYEKNTGVVIAEAMRGKSAKEIPAILVRNHGPFTWGKDANDAVYYAAVLEQTAKMALLTETMNPKTVSVEQYLLDKHYFRKHGKDAYYGQGEKNADTGE